MEEALGYIAALLIGVSLGLIGGGGSILTVPVLVFFFGTTPTTATAYSLFIVGVTAFVGSIAYARQKMVDFRTALIFAPPAFLGVYMVRRFLVPSLPENLFSIGSFDVTRDRGIMLLFGILMLGTALSMIRSKTPEADEQTGKREYRYGKIIAEGLAVGALTGLVGAGGGFLVIPALVLLAKLPMKEAVGTSLLIIAAKSLLGFIGDLQNSAASMDWTLLATVTGVAVGGLFLGTILGRIVPGSKLKPAFGYFVLIMGIYMVGSEVVNGTTKSDLHQERGSFQEDSRMNTQMEVSPSQLAQELDSSNPPGHTPLVLVARFRQSTSGFRLPPFPLR